MRLALTASRSALRTQLGLRHVAQVRHYARTTDSSGAYTKRSAHAWTSEGNGPLENVRIAVKDNIATCVPADLPTTASSRILANHKSPFDATVVKLLRNNGAVVDAKTALDEFGMGSHSQNAYSGSVTNIPERNGKTLSPGGSSGGSAVAVASGEYDAALGTDTGGSVRLPAAYTATVGFKPSYGLLSRWGVIQYANSLDTVGILAKNVVRIKDVFNAINKHDNRDPTSLSESVRERIQKAAPRTKSGQLRIGVPIEYNIQEMSPIVRQCYIETLKALQREGCRIVPVNLPSVQHALSAYYVLAPAEASSNLAKYDGIRYGTRAPGSDSSPKEGLPLYASTRGEGFGEEVKRRILLGAYTLSSEAIDNYFIQAQKVRRLVQDDFDRVFARPNPLRDISHPDEDNEVTEGVDILVTPTAPTPPPTIEEVQQQSPVQSYMNDVFTVPASLAGLPAISVPVYVERTLQAMSTVPEGTNVGMQIIGQFGDDKQVLAAAQRIIDMQANNL